MSESTVVEAFQQFFYGRKVLSTYISKSDEGIHEAGDYIENRRGLRGFFTRRRNGETTHVYEQSMNWLQEQANRLGEPIVYVFETPERHMIAWARNPEKGRRVLEIEDEEFRYSGFTVVATRIFYPKSE